MNKDPMIIHWSEGMLHEPMYLPPHKRLPWMNGRMYLPAIEPLPEEEPPTVIIKHIFKHSIKVDRGSFKLDQRIEALEKQRSTSKKKHVKPF